MKNLLLILAISAIAILPEDIMMRHDVDESKYLAMGERYGKAVVEFEPAVGTLIHPNWILTAAHVASAIPLSDSVKIGGVKYKIKRKILNNRWFSTHDPANDIALVEIEGNVTHVHPVKLYQESDELGQRVIFVGTGYAGFGDRGLKGTVNKDRKMRGAENRVEEISETGALIFYFDEPGTERALPLEGISGPGDSGGPAYIIKSGELYLAGVSSSQTEGNSSGRSEGIYKVHEHYARVSQYIDWINKHTGKQ